MLPLLVLAPVGLTGCPAPDPVIESGDSTSSTSTDGSTSTTNVDTSTSTTNVDSSSSSESSSSSSSESSSSESSSSGVPQACGNGELDPGEDCDDGNTDDGDECPSTCAIPTACADVLELDPAAPDGDYTLYYEGQANQPWTAYCHDMAGAPTEYLPLQQLGPELNFAQYTAGGASPGTDVRTNYERVRIDPATLEVDIDDRTFSSSTGSLMHGEGEVTSMSYGVAMSCDFGPSGVANIDLTGTPFVVADPFCVAAGFDAFGEVTVSPDSKVVDLTGGGFCGWSSPDPCAPAPESGTTGALLDLAYMP